jgi:hypothetical protein
VYLDKFTGDLGGIDYEVWLRAFAVNTLGPLRVTGAPARGVVASP